MKEKDQENGIEQLNEREEKASYQTQVLVDLEKKGQGGLKCETWVVEGFIWQLVYVDLFLKIKGIGLQSRCSISSLWGKGIGFIGKSFAPWCFIGIQVLLHGRIPLTCMKSLYI